MIANMSIKQPWHYWHFGLDNSLLAEWGYSVHCRILKASLDSTCWMLVALTTLYLQYIKEKYLQILSDVPCGSGGGGGSLPVENHWPTVSFFKYYPVEYYCLDIQISWEKHSWSVSMAISKWRDLRSYAIKITQKHLVNISQT